MKIFSHHHYIQTGSIRLQANGKNGAFFHTSKAATTCWPFIST